MKSFETFCLVPFITILFVCQIDCGEKVSSFLKSAVPCLFFFIFVLSVELSVSNALIIIHWIQTLVLSFRKCHLCHNDCPVAFIYCAPRGYLKFIEHLGKG